MRPPNPRPFRQLALVALSLIVFATACGGGSDADAGDGIASLAVDEASVDEPTLDTDGAATAGTDEERTFEDASLDFAMCVREEGISEWPDPTPGQEAGGRPFADVDFDALGIDPRSDEVQAILDTCRGAFEGVAGPQEELTPEEQAEQLDEQIAIAACVRENPGWEDFPDPDPNGGGFQGLRDSAAAGEFDFAELRTLLQECASQLGLEIQGQGGRGGQGA